MAEEEKVDEPVAPGLVFPAFRVVRAAQPRMLIPPLNFAMVDKGVYRSGYPNSKNLPFLEDLGLKSILYLCPEKYRAANLEWVEQNHIKFFQYGVKGNKEPFVGIQDSVFQRALLHVLDKRTHPILIHCNKGTHRTGCLVGCLRKVQQLSLTAIFAEYKRFTGSKARLLDQQFIELFDHEAIEADMLHLPSWMPSPTHRTPGKRVPPAQAGLLLRRAH